MAVDEASIAARVVALLRGQGFRGRQGATGPAGATGAAGAQGVTGATGPAGGGGGSGTVTSVAGATGITGGAVTSSGVLYLALSGSTPGTYNKANVTVDGLGRVTVATGTANAAQEVTSSGGAPTGTVLSLASEISRITSDNTGGVSVVSIPSGTYVGQVHYAYFITDASSGGGDSVRCYPKSFFDGTYTVLTLRTAYGWVWSASGWKQFQGSGIN